MTTSHRSQAAVQGGFTTVELAVAMTVTALLATVMLTWISGVYGADTW